MYKTTADFEQYMTATGNHAVRVKRNGSGFVGSGEVEINDNATSAELELEKRKLMVAIGQLTEESSQIRSQIAAAAARRAAEGVWADRDWWRRANFALREKGRQMQQLQWTLGEVNRRLRATSHQERDSELVGCLMEVAKEIIGEAKWRIIYAAAEDLRARRNVEGR